MKRLLSLHRSSQSAVLRRAAHCAPRRSVFERVKMAPPDAILGLAREFADDPHPNKVNLAVGVYRDDNGEPVVLEAVRRAAQGADMDYAPITGLPGYVDSTRRLCFGDDILADHAERIASAQTLSGTGALSLGAALLQKLSAHPDMPVYAPTPTYGNHAGIFHHSGLELQSYPYYDYATNTLQIELMLDFLSGLPAGAVVLLHACAHNPTGVDPTMEDWEKIIAVCAESRLIPFVDMAYQGFATGDMAADAYVPRALANSSIKTFLVAQSFAKNFGLYGQRVGALHVACNDAAEAERLKSQMAVMIRATYSNPPIWGAHAVHSILTSPELTTLWREELQAMSQRMYTVRAELVAELKRCGSTKPWDHLATGVGMMGMTGLNPDQVQELKETYHIYLTGNGRIAFSGLTSKNLPYVANAFHEVTK